MPSYQKLGLFLQNDLKVVENNKFDTKSFWCKIVFRKENYFQNDEVHIWSQTLNLKSGNAQTFENVNF